MPGGVLLVDPGAGQTPQSRDVLERDDLVRVEHLIVDFSSAALLLVVVRDYWWQWVHDICTVFIVLIGSLLLDEERPRVDPFSGPYERFFGLLDADVVGCTIAVNLDIGQIADLFEPTACIAAGFYHYL